MAETLLLFFLIEQHSKCIKMNQISRLKNLQDLQNLQMSLFLLLAKKIQKGCNYENKQRG